jgi:dolichyl-diphosphooligosaccharide--protein glycosyltransferase
MWMAALDWMRVNTPESGVDLGSIIERPPAGTPYAQAADSYGVLSWWDYGHWMEVVARRAPVANPFQQAAPFSSCYFTERDPERAEVMLAQWSQLTYVRGERDCDDVELPALADVPKSDENPIRYLMIDDEMAAGKFGAITVWAGCDVCIAFNQIRGDANFNTRAAYYEALFKHWKEYSKPDGSKERLPWSGEPYAETMLSRLYFKDGNTLENYRLVYETPYGVRMGWVAGFGEGGLFSHNQNDFLSDRRGWAADEWTSTRDRMFPTSDNRFIYDSYVVASVKTYEHVKGANVTGSGAPPGSFVALSVPLASDSTGRTFEYEATTTAAADGSFSFIVPYATTAYLPVAEGGTATQIVARGPADIYAGPQPGRASHEAKLDIPDLAVLEGQAVGVTLAAVTG